MKFVYLWIFAFVCCVNVGCQQLPEQSSDSGVMPELFGSERKKDYDRSIRILLQEIVGASRVFLNEVETSIIREPVGELGRQTWTEQWIVDSQPDGRFTVTIEEYDNNRVEFLIENSSGEKVKYRIVTSEIPPTSK